MLKDIEGAVYKTRVDIFRDDNSLLISLKSVIDNDNISLYEKQLCVELLLVYYENHFVEDLVKDSSYDETNRLNTRVFTSGYYLMRRRIEALLNKQPKAAQYIVANIKANELSRVDKTTVLLSLLDLEVICNNVFSYVFKSMSREGYADEIHLVIGIADIVATMLSKISKTRPGSKSYKTGALHKYLRENAASLTDLTVIDQVEVGQTLLDMFLDSYLSVFERFIKTDKKKKLRCVRVNDKYSSLLYSKIFSPAVVPMVSLPAK